METHLRCGRGAVGQAFRQLAVGQLELGELGELLWQASVSQAGFQGW